MVDIDKLSEDELHTIVKRANERIAIIERKKEEEVQRKKNYHLVEPAKKYKIDYCGFYNHIIRTNFGETMNKEIKNIVEQHTSEIPNKNEEIFPCPICGEMSLRAKKYSDFYHYKYFVGCNNCCFDIEKETCGEKEAWQVFIKWLIKNGYLSEAIGL